MTLGRHGVRVKCQSKTTLALYSDPVVCVVWLGLLIILVSCLGCVGNNVLDSSSRQEEKFDFDWKFSKGDFPQASRMDFDDSQWQLLDVPHDWSILDTFSEDHPTGKPGGYASGGVGWYRKHFTLKDKDASSMISIEFGWYKMISTVFVLSYMMSVNSW